MSMSITHHSKDCNSGTFLVPYVYVLVNHDLGALQLSFISCHNMLQLATCCNASRVLLLLHIVADIAVLGSILPFSQEMILRTFEPPLT